MKPSAPGSAIAIVGAGSVGATIAYAAMIRGAASRITLIDSNAAKCAAEVKDLNHGLRFVPSLRVEAGDIAACAGADVVIVTAGAKQKPGQSRLDLAATNIAIFRELIPAICAAAPEALLLIVSNPVDVLTYAAARLHACGADRVLGSGTVLDSSRFVTLIAQRLRVSVHNVHAFIVGEHGDSELPLWSSAHVGNVPLSDFRSSAAPPLNDADRAEIFTSVRSAACQIIAAKGATNWAIGLAANRILDAVLRHENAILPVSRLLHEYHGVSDVCLSVPCVVNRQGAEPLPAIPMNEAELAAFRHSAHVVRQECLKAGLF